MSTSRATSSGTCDHLWSDHPWLEMVELLRTSLELWNECGTMIAYQTARDEKTNSTTAKTMEQTALKEETVPRVISQTQDV